MTIATLTPTFYLYLNTEDKVAQPIGVTGDIVSDDSTPELVAGDTYNCQLRLCEKSDATLTKYKLSGTSTIVLCAKASGGTYPVFQTTSWAGTDADPDYYYTGTVDLNTYRLLGGTLAADTDSLATTQNVSASGTAVLTELATTGLAVEAQLTASGTADQAGSIVIVGTDELGAAKTATLTISAGGAFSLNSSTTKFRTVTSVTAVTANLTNLIVGNAADTVTGAIASAANGKITVEVDVEVYDPATATRTTWQFDADVYEQIYEGNLTPGGGGDPYPPASELVTGSNVVSTTTGVGVDNKVVDITAAGLGATPSAVFVTIRKPAATDPSLYCVDMTLTSAAAVTLRFSATTTVDYALDVLVVP